MNYYQLYYFSESEIEKANNNLLIISNKIQQLHDKIKDIKKLDNFEDCSKDILKFETIIDRLNMSKNCIKHYYNIV